MQRLLNAAPDERSVVLASPVPAARGGALLAVRGREALALLIESFDYAEELGRSAWDFAVEIDNLRAAGVTTSDLRWLVCKGYVEHARESTLPGDHTRSFRAGGGLTFSRRTSFILTAPGVDFASRVLAEAERSSAGRETLDAALPDLPEAVQHPRWDRERQELRFGDIVVKQYKVPAANQETILAAFEEEGWPVRLDDPLPPHPHQDSKRRLHDTIVSLNRNQKNPVIRFSGDGSGQGVRWQLLDSTRMKVSGNGSEILART
jgi:hypothetical protein